MSSTLPPIVGTTHDLARTAQTIYAKVRLRSTYHTAVWLDGDNVRLCWTGTEKCERADSRWFRVGTYTDGATQAMILDDLATAIREPWAIAA